MDGIENRKKIDDGIFCPVGERRDSVGDVPKQRRCLACGEPFDSEGWGNRLCPKCRKR